MTGKLKTSWQTMQRINDASNISPEDAEKYGEVLEMLRKFIHEHIIEWNNSKKSDQGLQAAISAIYSYWTLNAIGRFETQGIPGGTTIMSTVRDIAMPDALFYTGIYMGYLLGSESTEFRVLLDQLPPEAQVFDLITRTIIDAYKETTGKPIWDDIELDENDKGGQLIQ